MSPAPYIAKGAIFVAAAALCIPALIALSFIRSDEIDYARARNAKSTKQSDAKGSASKLAGAKQAVTAREGPSPALNTTVPVTRLMDYDLIEM